MTINNKHVAWIISVGVPLMLYFISVGVTGDWLPSKPIEGFWEGMQSIVACILITVAMCASLMGFLYCTVTLGQMFTGDIEFEIDLTSWVLSNKKRDSILRELGIATVNNDLSEIKRLEQKLIDYDNN